MTDVPIVRSVRARSVVVPFPRPLRTASGSIPSAPLVLIDIETEEGVPGRAYLFGYTTHVLRPLCDLIDSLSGIIVGRAAAPTERANQFAAAFKLLGRQGLLGMALAGLDMAFWDVLGRVMGLPLAELLGGQARPLPAYDSFGIVDPIEDRPALEASIEKGFKAIKIKAGAGTAAEDAQMVRSVRDIVGPGIKLMVDLNQSQSVPDAIRRIDLLSAYDLTWVEEPVSAEDLVGHAGVRASSRVPIQTGENWWFATDMARAIEAKACDFAMPDLMKIGGVTGWLKAMALAEAASLPISSHIFPEASAHVLAVSPTAHYLEWLDTAGAVLSQPLKPIAGSVTARGPGLGMDWDESAVRHFSAS
ncbi:MAG TPA: enolase C-terminal domain-like protein [Alphaproteobacteria bacterium]|nr:enolase C-terminal domain-like protein [Alphaproteobacteria bacterium]